MTISSFSRHLAKISEWIASEEAPRIEGLWFQLATEWWTMRVQMRDGDRIFGFAITLPRGERDDKKMSDFEIERILLPKFEGAKKTFLPN